MSLERHPWISPEEARIALRTGRGGGIKIAVLDSGIEVAHPVFRALRLADDLSFAARDGKIVVESGEGIDPYGHGTAVAGIIHSLAPDAEIGSFRVLGPQLLSRTGIVAAAAREALAHGYHVLNCSFGCCIQEHIHAFKGWTDLAYSAQAHVVAACNSIDTSLPEWPAHLSSVIAVDMMETSDGELIGRRPGQLVEFAALGVDVEVPWREGGSRQMTGSSLAAPRVAGLLARLLSVHPRLTPTQAKALLQHLAQPLLPGTASTPRDPARQVSTRDGAGL